MIPRRCENCGNDTLNCVGECAQCGVGPLISPGNGLQEELATPRNITHPKCPSCRSTNFDGWDCKDCGFALPMRDRTIQPAALSPEDEEALKKKLKIK